MEFMGPVTLGDGQHASCQGVGSDQWVTLRVLAEGEPSDGRGPVMDRVVMPPKCSGNRDAQGVVARERVWDHIVFTNFVGGSEVTPLQLGDLAMMLAVGAAGCCAPKEVLKGGVVRKKVKLMTMEPRAEVLHCPSHRHALALCSVVAALDIRKDAAGVTNRLVATIGVLLGEDRAEGRAAGNRMEIKLLAEV